MGCTSSRSYPYRSWCQFCVKGRGTGLQHRRSDEEDKVPVFGFDYLLGTHSIEGEQREEVKIVAAKCHDTKCVFSHVIPQKGIDPKLYVVDRLKRDVLWLGHNKIMLKSDNEKAIVALLTTNLKALRI